MTNCGAGMASNDLAQAAGHCQKCSQSSGNLQAVWKLMGDIHLQFHAATPPPPQPVWAQHSRHDAVRICQEKCKQLCLEAWPL